MSFEAFMATLKREWWWSPLPPWKYIKHGTGWGTLQEPGVFNLVWAASGEHYPPQGYGEYASKIMWVLTGAAELPIAGQTLGKLASTLTLTEFEQKLRHHRRELDRWDFSDGQTTSSSILRALRSAEQRAKTQLRHP